MNKHWCCASCFCNFVYLLLIEHPITKSLPALLAQDGTRRPRRTATFFARTTPTPGSLGTNNVQYHPFSVNECTQRDAQLKLVSEMFQKELHFNSAKRAQLEAVVQLVFERENVLLVQTTGFGTGIVV